MKNITLDEITSLGEMTSLLRALGGQGLERADIATLCSDNKLAKKVVKQIKAAQSINVETVKVVIDYSKMTDLIVAARITELDHQVIFGHYEKAFNEKMAKFKKFEFKGSGKHEVELGIVDFPLQISDSKDIKAILKAKGFKQPGMEHVLALCAIKQETEESFSVVAFNSFTKPAAIQFLSLGLKKEFNREWSYRGISWWTPDMDYNPKLLGSGYRWQTHHKFLVVKNDRFIA